jgi:dUTP pyrophosphatase
MLLEYYMIREDVYPPVRANPSDAGLDICYSPDLSKKKGISHDLLIVEPWESVIIPTGLKFGVPHGYMLEVKNRSSMAAKRNLIVGACVIDSGYDGEVFVNLHNIGRDVRYIKPGERVAQVVMVPVVHFRAIATSEDNLYGWYPITVSDRGDGALGSTDKK